MIILITPLITDWSTAKAYPIQSSLGGVQSIYTNKIVKILTHWPSFRFSYNKLYNLSSDPSKNDEPIRIKCLTTKKEPLYIGVEQFMLIHAPLEEVRSVLNDIDHYQELFPGFKTIKVLDKDYNRWLTFWEALSPTFLVPNIKYEMVYLVDQPSPDLQIYRYQLHKPSEIRLSDGFIRLERMDSNLTAFIEYDFFDANWGVLKVLGEKKIWFEALQGIVLSDLGIRLKSENPSWDYEQIRKMSKKLFDKEYILKEIKERKVFDLLINVP